VTGGPYDIGDVRVDRGSLAHSFVGSLRAAATLLLLVNLRAVSLWWLAALTEIEPFEAIPRIPGR
jgi:hypothetical protein